MKLIIFIVGLICILVLPISNAIGNDHEIIDYTPFDIDRSEHNRSRQYESQDKSSDIKYDDKGRVVAVPARRPSPYYVDQSVQKERCARITFYLAGYGRILLGSIQRNFKATFADGLTKSSYSVFIDDLSMGRIALDNTYEGSVCFGISDYPIIKIEYEEN